MSITWLQGDCRDLMPGLAANCVITDPPYGTTPQPWDTWPDGWVKLAAGCARSMWCFGSARMWLDHGGEFAAAGWKFAEDIVWEKHNGSGPGSRRKFYRVHETAYHWYQPPWSAIYSEAPRVPREGPRRASARRAPENTVHQGSYGAASTWTDDGMRLMRSVIRARSLHRIGTHTAQKPDLILRALVEAACPPGGTVLDPFAGSGAVLRAAAALGRNAIGIDLSVALSWTGRRTSVLGMHVRPSSVDREVMTSEADASRGMRPASCPPAQRRAGSDPAGSPATAGHGMTTVPCALSVALC